MCVYPGHLLPYSSASNPPPRIPRSSRNLGRLFVWGARIRTPLSIKQHLLPSWALLSVVGRVETTGAGRRSALPPGLHPLHVHPARGLRERWPQGPLPADLHHQWHQEGPQGQCPGPRHWSCGELGNRAAHCRFSCKFPRISSLISRQTGPPGCFTTCSPAPPVLDPRQLRTCQAVWPSAHSRAQGCWSQAPLPPLALS